PMPRTRLFLIAGAFLLSVCAYSFAVSGVDIENSKISLAIRYEPPSLNTVKSSDRVSSFLLTHLLEGLTRYGRDNNIVPAAAESWQQRGSSVTFYLRKDARWNDGKPVTAHNFVFAWRTLVDPATASKYAFIMEPVKHAAAITRGERKPDELGVQALDDFTLKVELHAPTPYFVGMTAFPAFYPIRKDFYQQRGARYAADAKDMLFNGPFELTEWVHGASLKLRKNPRYWNNENIRIRAIDIPYITSDSVATLNLFKNNNIAFANDLAKESIADALQSGLPLRKFLDGCTYFYSLNFRAGRITRNKALRQALQSVYDSTLVTNKIIAMPGAQPGLSLFPQFLRGKTRSLREEIPPATSGIDLARARRLLQQAKDELQIDQFPPLVLLTSDVPVSVKLAEYVQYLFKQALSLTIVIDKQTFKQRHVKSYNGEFDIASLSWCPDYDDPLTFADYFASWNENNRGKYANPEYDEWVKIAQNNSDTDIRINAFGQLQRIIADDVVILPSYEASVLYVQHPHLKGMQRGIFSGDPSFYFAWLER
ncbi:MAG: peptide ABC transporter substrate-binding protein, partial [Pseudomonadales bacterium]